MSADHDVTPDPATPTQITDQDGGTFYIGDAGDVWFPPFPLGNSYSHQKELIQDLHLRDDDVILTGYGKSGSHWHFEILTMLLTGRADYTHRSKPELMLDRLSLSEMDDITSPRVLNTHVPPQWLPRDARKTRTKVVLLVRNPKDVCVSMYNHMRDWTKGGYSGTWEGFFNTFLDTGAWYGNWFTMMSQWEAALREQSGLNVFVSSYEAMQKDPVEQIVRLAQFLDKPQSREFCRDVAHKCSFHNLKVATQEFKVDHFKDIWREGAPGFYRKGIVGDWQNWFSKEQNDRFDKEIEKQRNGSNLDIVFKDIVFKL